LGGGFFGGAELGDEGLGLDHDVDHHAVDVVADEGGDDDAGDTDDQAPEGTDQGGGHTAGEVGGLGLTAGGDHRLEGHDHAVHRSEQADHGADGTHDVEQFQGADAFGA